MKQFLKRIDWAFYGYCASLLLISMAFGFAGARIGKLIVLFLRNAN